MYILSLFQCRQCKNTSVEATNWYCTYAFLKLHKSSICGKLKIQYIPRLFREMRRLFPFQKNKMDNPELAKGLIKINSSQNFCVLMN